MFEKDSFWNVIAIIDTARKEVNLNLLELL